MIVRTRILWAAGITVSVIIVAWLCLAAREPPPLEWSTSTLPGRAEAHASANSETATTAQGAFPKRPVSDEEALQAFFRDALDDSEPSEPLSVRALRAQMLSEESDPEWDARIRDGIQDGMQAIRADFGEGPHVSSVECRLTLCQVLAVTPASLSETPADWLAFIKGRRDLGSLDVDSTHNTMRVLPDGRILYVTFLVR